MVADFIDLEQNLKRRFREDSITDILLASLLSLPGNRVVVMTPLESKTGGDFDLVIVEPSTGDSVQFRIQAKRLSPHHYNWAMGSYVELAHPHNRGIQSKKLVSGLAREMIHTIPLYAFYNPAHVCAASADTISGIELASGWEVRERIKAIVRVKPKRLPFKRLGSLQPLFFPLATILCPPDETSTAISIPRPALARRAVEQAIEARSALASYDQAFRITGEQVKRLPAEAGGSARAGRRREEITDSQGGALPAVVLGALERRQERIVAAKIKRTKVLLIAELHD